MLLDFGMCSVYDLELKATSMQSCGCCTCVYALRNRCFSAVEGSHTSTCGGEWCVVGFWYVRCV